MSRYYLGNIVDQFNDNESTYELSGGVSSGACRGLDQAPAVRRALRSKHVRADARHDLPAIPLPPDRTLSYPFVGFDIVEDKYRKVGDENQIGKTEDLYFGTEVTGQIGYSERAYGGERQRAHGHSSAVTGVRIARQQQLFLYGDFTSRYRGQPRAQSDRRRRGQVLLALARRIGCSTPRLRGPSPTPWIRTQQLLLGGDNGLRGYPLRYEAGTSRALLTVEQRVFTDWYPFRLVRVGRRGVRRCRKNMGQRRSRQQRPRDAERRRLRLAVRQHPQRARQRVARRSRLPARALPRNSRYQFLVQTCRASSRRGSCGAATTEKADAHGEIQQPPAVLARCAAGSGTAGGTGHFESPVEVHSRAGTSDLDLHGSRSRHAKIGSIDRVAAVGIGRRGVRGSAQNDAHGSIPHRRIVDEPTQVDGHVRPVDRAHREQVGGTGLDARARRVRRLPGRRGRVRAHPTRDDEQESRCKHRAAIAQSSAPITPTAVPAMLATMPMIGKKCLRARKNSEHSTSPSSSRPSATS